MPAISVAQWRAHPGKGPEFIALCKEGKQLSTKHGLTTRLFLSVLAGPNVGTHSLVAEAADLATLATDLQNSFADPAWPSLQTRFFGPEGVCTNLSFSQATEVPL